MKIEFTASYLSLLSVWSLLITLDRKRGSACSPGYTETQSVAQTGPELTEILLPHVFWRRDFNLWRTERSPAFVEKVREPWELRVISILLPILWVLPVTNPVGTCQALVKPATGSESGSMVHILAVSSTISNSAVLPQGTGVAVCRLKEGRVTVWTSLTI